MKNTQKISINLNYPIRHIAIIEKRVEYISEYSINNNGETTYISSVYKFLQLFLHLTNHYWVLFRMSNSGSGNGKSSISNDS